MNRRKLFAVMLMIIIIACSLYVYVWVKHKRSRELWSIQLISVWEAQIDSGLILDVKYVRVEDKSLILVAGQGILALMDPADGHIIGSIGTYREGLAYGFLAVGDVDGDGDYDIVTTIFNASTCYHYFLEGPDICGEVVAIDMETLEVLWKTNILLPHASAVIPTLIDFDGDGKMEVLLEDIYSTVYLIDDQGKLIWKKRIFDEVAEYAVPRSVTVGDVDGDGEFEAVVAGNRTIALIEVSSGEVVWRMVLEEYTPSTLRGTYVSQLTLADINNDGRLEVVCGSSTGMYVVSPQGGLIWHRKHAGDPSMYCSVSIGDVDSDGMLDIVAVSGRTDIYVSAYRGYDGAVLGSYHVASRSHCGRIDCTVYPEAYHKQFIVDIDGDKALEVFLYDWLSVDVFLGGAYRNKQPHYYSVVDFRERDFSTRWLYPEEGLYEIRIISDMDSDGCLEIVDLLNYYSPPTTIRVLEIGGSGMLTYSPDSLQNTNNILSIDEDADLLPSTIESIIGTDKHRWDTDSDTLPDGWEYMNKLDPLGSQDATLDNDNDGLNNIAEYEYFGDPWNSDTDDDGLSDCDEVQIGTDLRLNDTDGDGYSDGYEVSHGTDPLDPNDYPASFVERYWWVLIVLVVAVVSVVFFLRRIAPRRG